ncbi:MAG: hypothetical protein ACODAE_03905 [Gemmatimonadota bacterium]
MHRPYRRPPAPPRPRPAARTPTTLALGLAAALAASGCFRGVGVESEPGPTYRVEVVNRSASPMIVSYDDGSGERILGTVPAERREWFTIASPADRTVAIIAFDRDRDRSIRRTITLDPDDAVSLVIPA